MTESELHSLPAVLSNHSHIMDPFFGHVPIVFVLIQRISGLFLPLPESVPLSPSAGQNVVVSVGVSLQLPGLKHC